MIAVTFALPAESSEFIKLLKDRAAQSESVSGSIGGAEVRVFHTGVGETASSISIRRFLAMHAPDVLISAGFAGALTRELEVADLLIAENYTSSDWIRRSTDALGHRARVGILATAPVVTDTPAARMELARRRGAIAVDMETEFIAAACRETSVPLIALRAISDTPAAPLPAPPRVLFNVETQKTPLRALFLHIVKHPASLVRLRAFAAQIARARRQLASALALLVQDASMTTRRS